MVNNPKKVFFLWPAPFGQEDLNPLFDLPPAFKNIAAVRLVLRCLHQVKSSVLLHQLLPLPGLDQTVDHSSQCVPVQIEAPPTLHETGPLLSTAHKIRTNLDSKNKH